VRQVYTLAIKYGSQRLIHEVMPYLSAVKAGRIAARLYPARVVNLIMQVGLFPRWQGMLPDSGSWIPSWPPARRRLADALPALMAKPWWGELTPAVRAALQSGDAAYELPARDLWHAMRGSFWQPIDLYQMVDGAQRKAEELGLQGVILASTLAALSSAAASVLAQVAYEVEHFGRPFAPPVALITGGHLDVPVGEAMGVGGRNQEFALLWAQALGEGPLASRRIVVAAMDSDGTDGPGTQRLGAAQAPGDLACMAGGVVDGHVLALASAAGIDVAAELQWHNATPVLAKVGSAIFTGNTGMALGDLRVAIVR
jgi:glycerate-2-kinase